MWTLNVKNRCKRLNFVRLTLFRHNCIATWIILFIGATLTVHTYRTAALHAILSFLVSLFTSYDPQSHKILQFYCFRFLLSKKLCVCVCVCVCGCVGGGRGAGGGMTPWPPEFAAPRKLWKMLFISSEKFFSFWRYLNFCLTLT